MQIIQKIINTAPIATLKSEHCNALNQFWILCHYEWY